MPATNFMTTQTQAQRMMEVAQRSRRYLGGAAGLIAEYVRHAWQPAGGFRGRSTEGDLYYTVFGLECLQALGCPWEEAELTAYLRRFGAGDGLDFMHLACLARCWSWLPDAALPGQQRNEVLQRLERYRTRDGGYNAANPDGAGQLSSCFLAVGAYEAFDRPVPRKLALANCFRRCRTPDGALANEPGLKEGTTTATAGAVVLLQQYKLPMERVLIDWLLARHGPVGGFCAAPQVPQPDLVSTAAALFALHLAGVSLGEKRDRCVEFVEGLWHADGGFCGHLLDDTPDVEYTYYALLSLGVMVCDVWGCKECECEKSTPLT